MKSNRNALLNVPRIPESTAGYTPGTFTDDLVEAFAKGIGRSVESLTVPEWRMIARSLGNQISHLIGKQARTEVDAERAREKAGAQTIRALTREQQRAGTQTTKERPELFKEQLTQYVASLLRQTPALAEGRDPQVTIANLVCTDKAAHWGPEKHWNRRARKKTAAFYDKRYVRRAIRDILPHAMSVAKVKVRPKSN